MACVRALARTGLIVISTCSDITALASCCELPSLFCVRTRKRRVELITRLWPAMWEGRSSTFSASGAPKKRKKERKKEKRRYAAGRESGSESVMKSGMI